MVQWTFERTEKLIKYYKKYSKGDKPTMQECIQAETNLMIDDLEGEYSHIYEEWKKGRKTAAKAADIFCRRYEQPSDTDGEAKKRAENAKKIYNVMMGKAVV